MAAEELLGGVDAEAPPPHHLHLRSQASMKTGAGYRTSPKGISAWVAGLLTNSLAEIQEGWRKKSLVWYFTGFRPIPGDLGRYVLILYKKLFGFHGGSDDKESACNTGDPGLIPGSRRSPEEGNGNPLQYSCLENSMDRGAWQVAVNGVAKSWTRLSK